MAKWWKSLWCFHRWEYKMSSEDHYDFEEWFECSKCGKQKDINE